MLQATSTADSLGKIANLGGLAGVGLIAAIGIAIALLTVTLIGMVGVLSQHQRGQLRALPAIFWGIVVIAIPLLGTLLWTLTSRGNLRQPRAAQHNEVASAAPQVEPSGPRGLASASTGALTRATLVAGR